MTFDSELVERLAEQVTDSGMDDVAERLNLQRQLERGLALLPQTHRTVLLLMTWDR